MDNEKEISFGAFDSELMHQEIFIPEGFTATIDGDKIILTRKDSEDERIRKELIEHVKDQQSSFISAPDCRDKYEEEENNKYNSWLSWLEKQGKHKKFRDSIQVGDEVTRNSDGVIVNLSQLKRVAKKSEQKLPIEKLPEEMKTIEESLGFTTQEECDEYNHIVSDLIMSGDNMKEQKSNVENKKLTDVNHEYFSELLENDNSEDINDYAYQCVYCMSHDWTIENPTWDNVQSACRLGAKWQKKHNVSEDWSEEDEKVSKYALDIPQNWTKEDKERYISCLQRLSTGNPEQPETINSKWFKEHVYPQKQWKPSDAQIRALEYIIDNAHNTSYSCKIAKKLLEQLRKLKGE